FTPARFNLATLYNATGRNQAAEQVLREGLEHTPEDGELQYSLGLLLAEEQRLEQAVQALGEAARLLPQRVRVQYNYGLALQHTGQLQKAATAFDKAHRLDRNDPEVLQALIILYAQQRLWEQAYPYAEQLARLYPDEPGPRRMLQEIETMRRRAQNN
ncbi:MAG: tetratricopeptide repeat protein, partial [Candidatus Competibacteraceae bacterium]|nr:tetratricopeptide repeat protein [Candidatus Competibacteraceae bacterium]